MSKPKNNGPAWGLNNSKIFGNPTKGFRLYFPPVNWTLKSGALTGEAAPLQESSDRLGRFLPLVGAAELIKNLWKAISLPIVLFG
jgi:hypothetical protein